MATARPDSGFRFSMKSLIVALTVASVVFAMPQGYILVLTAAAWILIGAILVGILLRYRTRIYRLLAGAPAQQHREEPSRPPDATGETT
ncbi:MAG: hypothetical protein KDA44_07655 [Planctomycetales bacterium]|nr:hypothetical protein [Planctomycetales bacterium]